MLNKIFLFPGRALKKIFRYRKYHIMLLPTFRCNDSCAYCHINKIECAKLFPKECERSPREWNKALRLFPPAYVSISGGEPLLYENIVQLINVLPRKHKLTNFTTNLSLPFDGLRQIRNKDFKLSVSFHPHTVRKETLKRHVLKLRNYGFEVNVNFLAYPQFLHMLPALKSFFESEPKVLFWVDQYLDPNYRYSNDEKAVLAKYAQGDYLFGFDRNDKNTKACWAGSRFFLIIPNGDVFSCHAGFYYIYHPGYREIYSGPKREFYLGNLFDGSFRPLRKSKICNLPCYERCDLYYALPRRIEGKAK